MIKKAIDLKTLSGEPFEYSETFYQRSKFAFQAKGKIVNGRINYAKFYKFASKAQGQNTFNGPMKLDQWMDIDPVIKRAMDNPERKRTVRNPKPWNRSQYTSEMFEEGKWLKFSVYRSGDRETMGKLFARQFRPATELEPTIEEIQLERNQKYYLTEHEVGQFLSGNQAEKAEEATKIAAETIPISQTDQSASATKVDA